MEANSVEEVAKQLGSAIDAVRDAAFGRVEALLRDQDRLDPLQCMKLWKGLFYGLWNVDGDVEQVRDGWSGAKDECSVSLVEESGTNRRVVDGRWN